MSAREVERAWARGLNVRNAETQHAAGRDDTGSAGSSGIAGTDVRFRREEQGVRAIADALGRAGRAPTPP